MVNWGAFAKWLPIFEIVATYCVGSGYLGKGTLFQTPSPCEDCWDSVSSSGGM